MVGCKEVGVVGEGEGKGCSTSMGGKLAGRVVEGGKGRSRVCGRGKAATVEELRGIDANIRYWLMRAGSQ